MSDKVIDLFDKKTPQKKMIADLVQRNRLFKRALLDEQGLPVSEGANLLNGTIRFLDETRSQEEFASLQYSRQCRTTHGPKPEPYELLTCFSYREHILTGQGKLKPKLLWQVRVTPKPIESGAIPKPTRTTILPPVEIGLWLGAIDSGYPKDTLAGIGIIQRTIEYMECVLVRSRSTDVFYELNYDGPMMHCRIKLFAKGLKEDLQTYMAQFPQA